MKKSKTHNKRKNKNIFKKTKKIFKRVRKNANQSFNKLEKTVKRNKYFSKLKNIEIDISIKKKKKKKSKKTKKQRGGFQVNENPIDNNAINKSLIQTKSVGNLLGQFNNSLKNLTETHLKDGLIQGGGKSKKKYKKLKKKYKGGLAPELNLPDNKEGIKMEEVSKNETPKNCPPCICEIEKKPEENKLEEKKPEENKTNSQTKSCSLFSRLIGTCKK